MKIVTVDCNYVAHEFAASYLLHHQGKAMFVECNTNYAIPYLKAAVLAAGLMPEDVLGLIITHVHLDHAGGAGEFLRQFPNAKLYAHPRAARHAIDPAKLVASATQVYGEAFMKQMYGTILPCDASRVVVLNDGDMLPFEGVMIKTKHTRGHANHHLCVIEPTTQTLFSGDSFGVSYPLINHQFAGKMPVILPSTSPTDFDGPAAVETVEWIRDSGVNRVALTHYDFLEKNQIPAAAAALIEILRFSNDLLPRIRSENLAQVQITELLRVELARYYQNQGISLTENDFRILRVDLEVNAQGLHYAALKDAAKA